jgi:hypothetical protein
MSELIAFTQISPPVRMRNEHWQRRFSEDFALIERLREFAVEPYGAESLVNEVCEAFEVPMPEFAFNRRRKVHNGLYEPPRNHKLIWSGGEKLAELEEKRGKPFSETGVIRLANPVSVGTVAHEVAHHVVHHREHWATPSHGRIFVAWNDRTVALIAARLGVGTKRSRQELR